MGYPSELPAMRRQILPAPDSRVTALAWASLSYAATCAVLATPAVRQLVPVAPASVFGIPITTVAATAALAALMSALVLTRLAHWTAADWPAARYTAAYLTLLVAIAAPQITGAAASTKPYEVTDCCVARPR